LNNFFKLIIILLISSLSAYAQSFEGIATYKTQQKIDFEIDSTEVGGSAMKKQIMGMLKKQFQKTFLLSFDKNNSLYKEDLELAPPSVGSNIMVVNSGFGSGVLYKNIQKKYFIDQKETYGKQFIIRDSLMALNWVLQKETKNIGKYTCFKATYNIKTTNFTFDGDQSANLPVNREVTAWYAPQIPISNGPSQYHGLPGLILEVNDGDTTILCSSITLNPKDGVTIYEPKKGSKVSQAEYNKIMLKNPKRWVSNLEAKLVTQNLVILKLNILSNNLICEEFNSLLLNIMYI
jgi:GLPGLI family protein